MFENLSEYPIPLFEKTTLYEALEKNYGLPTIYNHELFGAVKADAETAKKLKYEITNAEATYSSPLVKNHEML